MRNLLLLLLLANILYFIYSVFTDDPSEPGVVVVEESDLGPPLEVTTDHDEDVAASVGAVLGSGEPSVLEAVVGRSCVSVGPFRTSADAESAQVQFAGDSMRARLRSQFGEVPIGNWVKIKGIADRFTANEMMETLQDNAMDAFIVNDDEEGLYISLGLFGDINGAEKIELQAKSLGLPAAIEKATREGTVFYVDIALPPGRGAGSIVDQYGEDKVFLRDAATCPQDS